MKQILKNKFGAWLIALLVLANIATLVFYWVGYLKTQKDNSPKEFLAAKLNLSESQKNLYFDLAKEHNENANKIRQEIKISKEQFFELLKSNNVLDSSRDNAALKVSLAIQLLDILTFEHFKKVRALCSAEQKPKFDELIQKMVNAVNRPQQGPPPSMK